MIIAITGPAGSGKTTISKLLAKKLPKCVNIEVDHVKHFVMCGFRIEKRPDGSENWIFEQWPLVGESIGLLAKNFQDNGYDVIINGFMEVAGWRKVEKHVDLTHKFLLLPHIDTAVERDATRTGYDIMGRTAIQEHLEEFEDNEFYKSFEQIDSTEHEVTETVEQIFEHLGRSFSLEL